MNDQRIHPRFAPVVIKAHVDIEGSSRQGYLTNVSSGGAFLAIADPPPIDTHLALTALLPWRLGELRATARVLWRNDPAENPAAKLRTSGVGLCFTRLEAGSDELLQSYLERFSELAARIDDSSAT